MIATIHYKGVHYLAENAIDISTGYRDGAQVNCYYAPAFESHPVIAGSFIGDTSRGGPVNYRNVRINPHGNGTHTECAAHIGASDCNIREVLTSCLFSAQLLSVAPLPSGPDYIITAQQVIPHITDDTEALIIRTLPNDTEKLTRQYSGTNPAYLDPEICSHLAARNIMHLLIDLPSVDREEDGGRLLAHRAFWQYPHATRTGATITELIFVPSNIHDGHYLLNLQIAPFEMDAAPSRPMLLREAP
jgi:arylformamidase